MITSVSRKTDEGCQSGIMKTSLLADCLCHVIFTIMIASPTWW